MNYTCKNCGETSFFYTEVSVMAKQRIDLKKGPRNKKIYNVQSNHIDNIYEDIIYCGKCDEQVDMVKWKDFID